MEDFQITPHFRFYEMTCTKHTELLDENRRLARADRSLMGAAEALCETLLEPIRAHYESPVNISSGYRYPELNRRVDGAENSQHLHFQAADFRVEGVSLRDTFDWIKDSDLPFGQVILEPKCVHISLGEPFRQRGYCRQALELDG
jgi:uncharacterized protein YcbK (DUF882 family)